MCIWRPSLHHAAAQKDLDRHTLAAALCLPVGTLDDWLSGLTPPPKPPQARRSRARRIPGDREDGG